VLRRRFCGIRSLMMNTRWHIFLAGCVLGYTVLAVVPGVARADAGPTDPAAIVVANKVPSKAYAFDLNEVQLLDGSFKHAQELNRRDLLAANMDVLYYPFRREAKLPSPELPPLPTRGGGRAGGQGYDGLNYTLTGHVLGHWLSACAFIIRNTGDAEVKAKAD